jgi:transposase InsO family protein
MKYRFIQEHAGEFSVREMCQVLKVKRSGFYAYVKCPESSRALADQELKKQIRRVFEANRGLYGSPRIFRVLRAQGAICSKKRVARLMREMGLRVRSRRRYVRTTDSCHNYPIAPNRLNREFDVDQIKNLDCAWAGDMTYIPTTQGWLYLAVIIDLKSRRVIGWSMGASIDQGLVQNALGMAIGHRLALGYSDGELFHSDQGSQYVAHAFQKQLREAGITGSMSRKGNCWDNAPVESFFATPKKEVMHREEYATWDQVRLSLFNYIEVYYNRMRLHSSLGYQTPEQYERNLHN